VGAFLVTGNPGSGKTTLARELSRRGYAALYADQLVGWETESGEEVTGPADATDAWQLAHRWVWRETPRDRGHSCRCSPGRDVFLCGIALSQRELLYLFGAVFLLALDETTQEERLRTPASAHRSEALRAQIREGRATFERAQWSAGARRDLVSGIRWEAASPAPASARRRRTTAARSPQALPSEIAATRNFPARPWS